MIISAKLIRKPRKVRGCAGCWKPIEGAQIRMFGCAEVGDPPYALYVHPEQACAGTSAKVKVILEAMEGQR